MKSTAHATSPTQHVRPPRAFATVDPSALNTVFHALSAIRAPPKLLSSTC